MNNILLFAALISICFAARVKESKLIEINNLIAF